MKTGESSVGEKEIMLDILIWNGYVRNKRMLHSLMQIEILNLQGGEFKDFTKIKVDACPFKAGFGLCVHA